MQRLGTPLLVTVLVALGAVGAYLVLHHKHALLTASPNQGLITNEFAYFNSTSPLAVKSSQWVMTSGSLFGDNGVLWTGVPDGQNPGPKSAVHTDSAVFRLHTQRTDFQNVSVSFRLRVMKFVTTSRTPAEGYDGVHVWLRYQNADYLYFASVARRDGELVIGKKLPPGATGKGAQAAAGGVYFHDLYVPGYPFPLGAWENINVSIENKGGQVIIRMFINGYQVARLIDSGKEGKPIFQPGAVGIRGDNTEFQFKDFKVTAI